MAMTAERDRICVETAACAKCRQRPPVSEDVRMDEGSECQGVA